MSNGKNFWMNQKNAKSSDVSKGFLGDKAGSSSPVSSLFKKPKENIVTGGKKEQSGEMGYETTDTIDNVKSARKIVSIFFKTVGLKWGLIIVGGLFFVSLFVLAIVGKDISNYMVYGEAEEFAPLVDEIKRVKKKYQTEYRVSIDGNLIIATLIAAQDEENYIDVNDMKDYVELLAKYQIITHVSGNCASTSKRIIASNDDSDFWNTDVNAEKNYSCDNSIEFDYYTIDTKKGSFDDDQSGSVYFWNLIDEDFIFKYYQDYIPDSGRNNEDVKNKINSIVKEIYLYYADMKIYIKDDEINYALNCEAVTVSKDTLSNNYGNVDDTKNGNLYLDLDDYVFGVLLAETGSIGWDKLNSNREALLNYYKTMAITIRSYTLGKTNSCTRGMIDSSSNQIYDDPSYYASTQYYDYVKQAVLETAGDIIIYNNQVLTTLYDNFDITDNYSCDDSYCSNVYTKIPSNDKQVVKVPASWQSSLNGGAGKGLSKYGAMYLALDGSNSQDIIKYFYANGIQFSSVGSLPSDYEVVGDYPTWTQYGQSWSGIKMGNSNATVKQIGCAITAISIQISRSGTQTTVTDFNPGVFVDVLSREGYFSSSGSLTSWYAPQQTIAPYFQYVNDVQIVGTVSEKAKDLQSYIDHGYYIVLGVRYKGNNNYGHWVALDHIAGNVIYMFDPGSTNTILYDMYPADSKPSIPLEAVMWKKVD